MKMLNFEFILIFGIDIYFFFIFLFQRFQFVEFDLQTS